MKTTAPTVTDPEISTPSLTAAEPVEPVVQTASQDPVVAEDVGHPVGVGIGALAAGVASAAAIGALAGPIGAMVGAVVGALAGGVIGEEVAAAGDEAETDNPDASYTAPDLIEPVSLATGGSIIGHGLAPEALLTEPAAEAVPAAEEETPVEAAQPPSEDAIRTSAYYKYVHRETAGIPGDALGDWLEAEGAVQNASGL